MRFLPILCLLIFAGVTARSVEGNRVLVLLDSLSKQASHSLFFGDLTSRGYALTFVQSDETAVELTHFGDFLYDHLIIFSPSTEAFGGLSTQAILDFVDSGRNLILAGDSQAEAGRHIARECGFEFAEPGFSVRDNFQYFNSEDVLSLTTGANLLQTPSIVGDKQNRKPILFKGISMTIPNNDGLHFSILGGYDTTFSSQSGVPLKQDDLAYGVGKQIVLLAGLQARNNARVVVSGSLSFFSDQYFRSASDNQYLASELSKWAFQESGVVRVSNISHHLTKGVEPKMYTIKDSITYTATIEEWQGDKWVPFKNQNVQLEISMLDPYIRTALAHDGKGHFFATFTAPDVYGIFSFKLRFRELGYTALDTKTVKSIRPYRHDQYPRFLTTAYPYYTGCISVVVGVAIFSAFFLFTKN